MVTVILVGIDGWAEYTKPAVDSILSYEPDVELIVIDNASDPPYPNTGYVLRTERMSYAEAINTGAYNTKSDWILSLNNDVVCQGQFASTVQALDPNAIYGREIIEEKGHTWLGNWLAVFTRSVFWELRGFDKNFEMCGFEDADFCVRGMELGYPTRHVNLPFHHHEGTTRWLLPNYSQVRVKNMKYFEQKHGYRLGDNVRVTHS
jgi:hypothetical protein